MTTLATNKKAHFDYDIIETYDAGLVLMGHEVKSVKTGHISLKGSFVNVRGGELYLTNALIPLYTHANKNTVYTPTRARKLLLHKSEIKKLIGKKQSEGLTLIPLRVYIKGRLVKCSFALARGKKEYDKRQTKSKNDSDRRISRSLRQKI